ncbi:hypothetical protein B296_00044881 [Ensete ventricosum]|uniref:Uncharacterized protein n=1 Tax=Ensete ventricosum TaxID=4639 RepID=A0A426XN66_ENSVE|nr:hypothetical protein B296_00044881 [Ensete ventricosum]
MKGNQDLKFQVESFGGRSGTQQRLCSRRALTKEGGDKYSSEISRREERKGRGRRGERREAVLTHVRLRRLKKPEDEFLSEPDTCNHSRQKNVEIGALD